MLFIRRAKRGVHPKENKFTRDLPIRRLDSFDTITIPLDMQLGPGCSPLVAKGDTVLVGQQIGEPLGGWSVPVHSSCSGTVQKVRMEILSDGDTAHYVTIKNDHNYTISPEVTPPEINNKDDFVAALRSSGLVGQGGAAFPTFVKMNPPPEKKVDLLLVNGAECEPYITSDHRVMVEYPDEVIKGCRIAAHWLGVEEVIICIEDNKPEAVTALRQQINEQVKSNESEAPIKIMTLPTMYPHGAEKVQIMKLTGRVVPVGGLPLDVGVVVQNVQTIRFIATYIATGMPLVRRIITLEGSAMKQAGNYDVPIGAHIDDVIEAGGGTVSPPGKIIMGGPMMGKAIDEVNRPVLKHNNTILAFTEEEAQLPEESACIFCGECMRACPMQLMPNYLDTAARNLDIDALNSNSVLNCIECGCCSYVCPAKRYLVQNIIIGKNLLRNAQKKGKVD
ncbi:MAG TPA: electron transport complex subunit RsxC [Clostridiaceae bacterium]|nr:electron transport complex subunit RsxC [Clostridiaceae bacterium]